MAGRISPSGRSLDTPALSHVIVGENKYMLLPISISSVLFCFILFLWYRGTKTKQKLNVESCIDSFMSADVCHVSWFHARQWKKQLIIHVT